MILVGPHPGMIDAAHVVVEVRMCGNVRHARKAVFARGPASLFVHLEHMMRLSIDAFLDYGLAEPADLLFALEVAQLPDRVLVDDSLTIGGVEPLANVTGNEGIGRCTRTRHGQDHCALRAIVDVARPHLAIAGLRASDLHALPALVTPYLWPSRYCEADRFETFVRRGFGHLSGGDQIRAIVDWIRDHVDYVPGASDATTTARDTFVQRQGVCRDFSQLLIAFARAAGVPARMVSAYAWRLEPQDFHAVVELRGAIPQPTTAPDVRHDKESTPMTQPTFTPTKRMASAARHGLRLRDKFDRGGTEVGVRRAHQLADRKELDADDIKSMHSYFARHAVDKEADGWGTDKDSSAGYIAWLLWGGDAGKDWADRNHEKL